MNRYAEYILSLGDADDEVRFMTSTDEDAIHAAIGLTAGRGYNHSMLFNEANDEVASISDGAAMLV